MGDTSTRGGAGYRTAIPFARAVAADAVPARPDTADLEQPASPNRIAAPQVGNGDLRVSDVPRPAAAAGQLELRARRGWRARRGGSSSASGMSRMLLN